MGIFHRYVSLPEGNGTEHIFLPISWLIGTAVENKLAIFNGFLSMGVWGSSEDQSLL